MLPTNQKSSSATRLAALGGLNNPTVYSRQSDGVVLNQLITDFGHTYDLTESAKFRANAASDRVAVARAIIVLEVDRTYFDVLRAQAVLRVAQETVKTRQVALDQVSVLVKNQLKSTLDESFDQVALSQAKLLLIQAQSGVQRGRGGAIDCHGISGRPTIHTCRSAAELDLPDSADKLVQLGLQSAPNLLPCVMRWKQPSGSPKPSKRRNFPRSRLWLRRV